MISWKEIGVSFSRQLQKLPVDLVAVVMLTVFIIGVTNIPRVNDTLLQTLLGLPLILFIPGYTLAVALFPAGEELPTDETEQGNNLNNSISKANESSSDGESNYTINRTERIALSFTLNIAIVSVLWLSLRFISLETRLTVVMLVIGVFTLLLTIVATQRRLALPVDRQFSVSHAIYINKIREKTLHPDSNIDNILNILLIIGLLLSISSVGYLVTVPPQDGFSEFYLLTENEDGTLVSGGYPSEFVSGESKSVVLGITNREYKPTEYTVIAEIQRVETIESRSRATTDPPTDDSIETKIIARERLGQFTTTLDNEETVHQSHELNPKMAGEDLRIQYLLFKNSPPADPTRENAYRSLRLWVDVFETEEDRRIATA